MHILEKFFGVKAKNIYIWAKYDFMMIYLKSAT
jgi:hypothetical protein